MRILSILAHGSRSFFFPPFVRSLPQVILSCAFLLCPTFLALGDGATQGDFYTLKSRIQTELQNMSASYSVIENAASGGIRELSGVDPNSSEYARCQSAIGYFSTILSTSSDLRSQLSYVQTLVSALEPTNSVSSADYTAILNQMNQRLLNIFGQLEDVNYRIYHDIQPRLDAIIEAVESIDAYVGEILRVLNDIKTILNQKLVPLCDWMMDVEGTYQQFYSNAVERIKSIDSNVQSDLAEMWRQTVYNYSNIVVVAFDENGDPSVSPRFTLDHQLSSVTIGDDFRLSNEGYINLQNLAMNERQYLCTIEALNLMRGMTNSPNMQLAWVTNYLDKVQAPFYRLFDSFAISSSPGNWMYLYGGENIRYFTNFVSAATLTDRLSAYNTWRRFRNNTNWFTRVETYLLNLQGALTPSEFDYDDLDSILDEEIIRRNLEYSTNAIVEASEHMGLVTNSLSTIFTSFQSLVSSFQFSRPTDSTGGLTILPSFQLGGIQFEHIHMTELQLEPYIDPMRLLFTTIWWVVFAVVFYKTFVFLVYNISRAFMSVVKLLGIILS